MSMIWLGWGHEHAGVGSADLNEFSYCPDLLLKNATSFVCKCMGVQKLPSELRIVPGKLVYSQRFLATPFGRKNSSDETRGLKKGAVGGLRRKNYWDKSEHGMKVDAKQFLPSTCGERKDETESVI